MYIKEEDGSFNELVGYKLFIVDSKTLTWFRPPPQTKLSDYLPNNL